MLQEQNVYDAVAYPGGGHVKSHPDNIAVMGILYGLDPAPVAACRVLEIGCSEGHNLVPMAYAIPGGHFVGVDLATEPVAAGQRRIERLGLTNVRLMQANLLQLDASLGTFDYIIVHGVYAWVPGFVQDGLMALIKKVLAPQGIAFVSYNALPGGHVRRMMREMLMQHSPNSGDTIKDVTGSLEFLQFIAESMSEKVPMRNAIARELKQMRRKGPSVTFHDEMAETFEPVSYTAFAEHAGRHGLEPFCDAEFPPPVDPSFNPEISAIVNGLSDDPVRREQTYDFIRMRNYRESLLCHARTERPDIDFTAVDRLLLASKSIAVPASAEQDTAERTFDTEGRPFTTADPVMIFILDQLAAAWPRSIAMTDVRAMMEAHGFIYDDAFLNSLFFLILNRSMELHSWQAPVTSGIPARPRISAYCRDAVLHNTKPVSLLHYSVELADPISRVFVSLLDGTRGAAALLEVLQSREPDVPRAELIKGMQPAMTFLQRMGLFLEEDFVDNSPAV